MKKAALIILIGIYGVASFGISVNSFYCCGKLTAVTLSLVEVKEAKCPAGASASCCNIRHQTFKVHDSHTGSVLAFHFNTFSAPHLPSFIETGTQPPAAIAAYGANTAHGPPLPSSCPLYIFHCDYRI